MKGDGSLGMGWGGEAGGWYVCGPRSGGGFLLGGASL